MTWSRQNAAMLMALLAGAALAAAPELAVAQQAGYPQPQAGYSYQEVYSSTGTPLVFGIAAYKICQIKSFLFGGFYVVGAIAFVIFALRALFTKFEIKHFAPILGALFIVASADLFIYWMSEDAFYCPTTLSVIGG